MTPDIRPVIEALSAYVEHRTALNKSLDAYEGYSPGYAFSEQIAERARLEQAAGNALEAFVRDAIRDASVMGDPRD